MNYRIVLTPDADADIGLAAWWYHRIDPNLAFKFVLESRATMNRIARFPYIFPAVRGSLRRARLKRFPYAMYYSVGHAEVFVRAIVHERRSDAI